MRSVASQSRVGCECWSVRASRAGHGARGDEFSPGKPGCLRVEIRIIIRYFEAMITGAPEPLWQVVVGDKEPWRRGRLFLILFAILSALGDFFTSTLLIIGGYISALLVFAGIRLVFWLQYYFVWIGVHWVRWLQGGVSMFYGLLLFVWSFEQQSGPMMVWGMFCIATGAYFGFAPSVHFFAVRQKENRYWLEALAFAGVFCLLLISLGASILGIFRYQAYLREELREFADTAFERVFTNHDTNFLLDHATSRALTLPNGRFRLTKFLQDATIRAGDVHEIQKATGEPVVRYVFPATLFGDGEMRAEGVGSHGRIVLVLRVVGQPGDWQIDNIAWFFPNTWQNRPN